MYATGRDREREGEKGKNENIHEEETSLFQRCYKSRVVQYYPQRTNNIPAERYEQKL
jgi:hypothetical protein